MSIVLNQSQSAPATTLNNISHTATDVLNAVSQDLRKQLAATGSDSAILLDYTSRISLEILRSSRWPFLLSEPVRFITAVGVTDYWIGTTGQQGQGSLDTGLNLSDVLRIDDPSFLDRSNNTQISRTFFQPPNFTTFEYPDGQSRPLRPTNFYHRNYNYTISLYPAPDNQNTYQPIPESPVVVGTTAGGSLPARTYTVRYSIIDATGAESIASNNSAKVFIPANFLLTVQSPSALFTGSAETVAYNKYKVYAANNSPGNETVQNNGTAIALGSSFTEPVGGITSTGASAPAVNNLTPLLGYVMEFKYWRKRIPITSSSQSLQIPDDYFDIVVAGVNYLGYQYLNEPTQVKTWMEIYQNGLRQLVRDKNQFNANDFLRPDGSTQAFPPGSIPGFIVS